MPETICGQGKSAGVAVEGDLWGCRCVIHKRSRRLVNSNTTPDYLKLAYQLFSRKVSLSEEPIILAVIVPE